MLTRTLQPRRACNQLICNMGKLQQHSTATACHGFWLGINKALLHTAKGVSRYTLQSTSPVCNPAASAYDHYNHCCKTCKLNELMLPDMQHLCTEKLKESKGVTALLQATPDPAFLPQRGC